MKYTSPLLSGASGSMGGSTYSHNRYGSYLRNRTVRNDCNVFASLTEYWSQILTANQRASWNTYASNVAVKDALGQDIYLSGFNHYIRSNSAILQAGLTRVDDAPVIMTLAEQDSGFACSASEATQLISVSFTDTLDLYDEDGAALLVSAGKGVNPTINFYNSPFRFADSIDGDSGTPPSSPQTVTAPFFIQETEKVFCQARIVRADGRLSNTFGANFLCAA